MEFKSFEYIFRLRKEIKDKDEKVKELEIKLRDFERAELIHSNREDVLPAIQEATYYNWLDDQIHEKDQLIFNLEEKYQEAVQDIESLDSVLGQFFEAYDHQAIRTCQKSSARIVSDIRSKYGLDKQERES